MAMKSIILMVRPSPRHIHVTAAKVGALPVVGWWWSAHRGGLVVVPRGGLAPLPLWHLCVLGCRSSKRSIVVRSTRRGVLMVPKRRLRSRGVRVLLGQVLLLLGREVAGRRARLGGHRS